MSSVSDIPRPRLWLFGTGFLLGCMGFYVVMQSSTLWEQIIILPGGVSGFPGSIRKLFPPEWAWASRTSSYALMNIGIYLFVLAVLFTFYWMALRTAFRLDTQSKRNARGALWTILLVAGAALFLFLWVPGSNSTDLYSYAWYGRIAGVFGENPFIHAPIEYASRDVGRWLQLVYWKDVTSVYGPVWVSLAAGIAWIAQFMDGELAINLLGHRLLAGIAHLANIVLVWKVAALFIQRYHPRFATDSDGRMTNGHASRFTQHLSRITPHGFQIAATLAYAWNPLALIEFGANGHNDVLMLTGILAAMWLHLKGKWRLAVLALTLAALVKVVAIFWLAGYAWILLWQPPWGREKPAWIARVGTLAQIVGLSLALWVICYIPFWEGPATFKPLWGGPPASLFVNSIASMLRWKGGEWLHSIALAQGWRDISVLTVDATRTLLDGPLRLAFTGIAIPFMAAAFWRARTFPRMVNAWGWAMFIYLTVAAVWVWPWYVAWLLPALVLAGPGRLFNAVQILCATSLLLYAIFQIMIRPFDELSFYRSLITIAPALCYAIGSWLILRLRSEKEKTTPVPGGQMITEAG